MRLLWQNRIAFLIWSLHERAHVVLHPLEVHQILLCIREYLARNEAFGKCFVTLKWRLLLDRLVKVDETLRSVHHFMGHWLDLLERRHGLMVVLLVILKKQVVDVENEE